MRQVLTNLGTLAFSSPKNYTNKNLSKFLSSRQILEIHDAEEQDERAGAVLGVSLMFGVAGAQCSRVLSLTSEFQRMSQPAGGPPIKPDLCGTQPTATTVDQLAELLSGVSISKPEAPPKYDRDWMEVDSSQEEGEKDLSLILEPVLSEFVAKLGGAPPPARPDKPTDVAVWWPNRTSAREWG